MGTKSKVKADKVMLGRIDNKIDIHMIVEHAFVTRAECDRCPLRVVSGLEMNFSCSAIDMVDHKGCPFVHHIATEIRDLSKMGPWQVEILEAFTEQVTGGEYEGDYRIWTDPLFEIPRPRAALTQVFLDRLDDPTLYQGVHGEALRKNGREEYHHDL